MNKILLLIITFVSFTNYGLSQCANDNVNNSGELDLRTCSWATFNMGPGEYKDFNFIETGAYYQFSTCNGGGSAPFDSRLTGYQDGGGNPFLFQSNNAGGCGDDADIIYRSTFAGAGFPDIRLLLDQGNCNGWRGGGTANSATIAYRTVPPTVSINQGSSTNTCGSVSLSASFQYDQNNAVTWTRVSGSGSISSAGFVSGMAANSSGVYRATVNNVGCSAIDNITVFNRTPTTPSASGTTTICTGGSATLTASGSASSGGFTYYLQTSPSGTSTALPGGSRSVSPGSTEVYYFRARSSISGCWSAISNSVTVTVTADPTSSISGGGTTTGCAGLNPSTLTGSVNNAAGTDTYQWTLNNNPISGATGTTYDPPALGAGTYAYRLVHSASGSGCGTATSSPITFTVTADPTASISGGGTTTGCAGLNPTTLTGSVNNAAGTDTYQWTLNNNPISGATGTTYDPPALGAGTYAYRLVHSASGAACGTATSSPITFTVTADPTSSISGGGTTTGCAGLNPTTLTGTVNDASGTDTYQWTLNNNPISGATGTTYDPPALGAGTYAYRLVHSASGAACGTATSTPITFVVTADPTASISGGGTTTGCAGLNPTTLTGSVNDASGTDTYQWTLNNNPISGATGTTYNPPALGAGTYAYRLVHSASGAACGPATSSPITFTVSADPSAPTIVGNPNTSDVCEGQTLDITISGGTGGTGTCNNEYRYSTNNGATWTAWSTSAPAFTAVAGTNLYQSRRDCDGSGCNSNVNEVSWNVLTLSVAPTTASPSVNNYCDNNPPASMNLTASGGTLGTGAVVRWFTSSCGGTLVGTGNPLTLSGAAVPTSNTTYYAYYSGACNTTGCASLSVTVQQVPSVPPTTVTAIPSANCVNALPATVQLIASGGSPGTGGTANWYTGSCGGTFVASGSSPVVLNPGVTTTYYVRYENVCGSTTCASVTYTVDALPTAAAGGSTTICENSSATVSGASASNGTILWTENGAGSITAGATTLTPTYTAASGDGGNAVTLTMTVTSNNTCGAATATATYTVNVDELPTFASAGADVDACIGSPTTMTADNPSVGTGTWSWTPSTPTYSTNANDPTTDVTFATAGTYTGTWTISNGVCPDASPADQVVVSVNSAATNVVLVPGTTITASEVCVESPWTYYANPATPDEYIFAIAKNGNTFTANISITDVPGTAPIESLGGQPNVRGTWLISRYWNVSLASGSIVNPVSVRFFIDDQERIDAFNDATAFAAANPWPTIPVSVSTLQWFKTTGAAFNPSTDLINGDFTFTPTYLTSNANGTINGVQYYEFNTITSFSGGTGGFTVNDAPTPLLPVELLSWEANAIDNQYVALDWSTATEVNNDGFEILRGTDGVNFERIAWVEGNGNSTVVNNYRYEDREVSKGITYYYQLKQVDYDGEFELFNIVSAKLEGSRGFSIGRLIPNPSSTNSTVKVDVFSMSNEVLDISIYNHVGVSVYSAKDDLVEGDNTIKIAIDNLASGTYFINFESAFGKETKKLVIVN